MLAPPGWLDQQALYQITRVAFTKNLKSALEARDAWWAEKVGFGEPALPHVHTHLVS